MSAATMRKAFASTVGSLLDQDPRVAVVLAAIGAGDGRDGTVDVAAHPGRVVDVGIREQLMVGVAAGMAMEGLRPVVHSYAPFLVERAFEQLKLDLVHSGVGAAVVTIGASYDWPAGGRTHQAPGDVALLDTLDGWRVDVPGHPDDVPVLLAAAVARDDLTYLRLTTASNARPSAVASTPAGSTRASVLARGRRGTVVAVGPMLDRVLAATAGLDVTVLHVTTVRPLDTGTLVATLDRPDVVLVEPYLAGTSTGTVSGALRHVSHRVLGLGVARAEHRRYGDPADHDRAHGLDADGIAARVRAFLRP